MPCMNTGSDRILCYCFMCLNLKIMNGSGGRWLKSSRPDHLFGEQPTCSQVSPKCPHFLKSRGTVRDLHGLKRIEKTKDREQVVDKINESLGSHGGDRGSAPLGLPKITGL